ncbi:MAG: hypothetical protein ACRC4N_17290 [Gammaproteobacteria bacterium]
MVKNAFSLSLSLSLSLSPPVMKVSSNVVIILSFAESFSFSL